jgi:hypothetical protein
MAFDPGSRRLTTALLFASESGIRVTPTPHEISFAFSLRVTSLNAVVWWRVMRAHNAYIAPVYVQTLERWFQPCPSQGNAAAATGQGPRCWPWELISVVEPILKGASSARNIRATGVLAASVFTPADGNILERLINLNWALVKPRLYTRWYDSPGSLSAARSDVK